jgi:CRP/FNR family transcriptional regulator, anaerobic regulatory protein
MPLALIDHRGTNTTAPRSAIASRSAIAPLAGGATMAELIGLLDGSSSPGATASQPLRLWRVRAGATLLHEGASQPWLHVVRSGAFKTLRTAEDGYQQVLSLLLPGDTLGFEALCRRQQPASAVALEDATVFALTLSELIALELQHPAFDRAVQHALTRQLVRCAETAEVMAAVAAEARMARFVLWLSTRMAAQGESVKRLRLRLGRRDLASLLGLAHETVSRAFTQLAASGCLRVDNREIEIIDRAQLQARARHTRGFSDEAPAAPLHPACAAA